MNQRLMPVLVSVAGVVVSVFIVLQVIFNPTGGLAGLLKYVAVPVLVLSFLSPKSGLMMLCFVGFYSDYYKKLAVYYGTSSMMTVMEVLALSMAMVGAVIGGAIAKALLRGPVPDKISRNIFFATMGLTAMILASGGDGLSSRVQYAVNGGLYLGLAAVMCYVLKDRESSLKLCRVQFWLGVPWVIWAARQYFFGFTDMEWFYARKGFSPVLYSQMMGAIEAPRPYGFAGSSSAYGVITYLFMFGLWHAVRFDKMRALYWIATLLYAGGLVVSTQRTILFLPLLSFGAYLLFRTAAGVKFFYISVGVGLFAGVLASDYLLANLDHANQSIRVEGDGWASKVSQVGTFSDRLRGWVRLKKASTYSLFGNKARAGTVAEADEYNHDVINKVLLNYGVVGLAVVLFFVFHMTRAVHRSVLRIRDPVDRDMTVFVVAALGVTGIGTLMSGNNSGTVPINLVLATLIGLAAGAMRRNMEFLAEEEKTLAEARPDEPVLTAGAALPRAARAQFRMRPPTR